MRIIRYISFFFIAMSVSSCMVGDLLNDENANPLHFVVGKVLDEENREIEHIKVTIDWGEHGTKLSVNYTASDGSFTAEIPEEVKSETIEFKITLEDIDGEENGGLFETVADKVIYSLDPESPEEIITYRLNRATPSESSPQS